MGDGWARKAVQRFVTTTKSHLVSGSGGALFQAMGFRYFGPIDGNDIAQVVDTLKKLKEIHKQMQFGWTKLHNAVTEKTVSASLTIREREVARMAAFTVNTAPVARTTEETAPFSVRISTTSP